MALTELFKKVENLADFVKPAEVEKARARTRRELLLATTANHDADVAYEVGIDDGADDETLRAALDLKTTTGWAVSRLTKRLAELDRKHADLTAKAREELLARLLQKVVAAGEEHGAAAAAAAETARKFVAAADELDRNDFRRERAGLEMFPPMVMDYSQSQTLHPTLATFETLDRWRHGIAALKRRMSGTPDAEVAPDGPTQPWSQRIGPGSPVDGRPRPRSTTGGWHS